ncbi:MAG TPA: hypothetical protein VFX61_22220 [Micromonosporaceae bacterium]|nr:hypothetical protein [Micromonosporaceae bacterium]
MSVSYTDARQPTSSFPVTNGTVPVGTSEVDDDKQTTRAYFTFDLSDFSSKRIIKALGTTGESTVNDCEKPRELELWRTDPVTTAPSWETAPTAREKIADLTGPAHCPARYLELLLTETIQQAVADGQDRITFMVRIAEDYERNKHYGRQLNGFALSIAANTPPDVPSKLTISGFPCADDMFIGTRTPYFTAQVTDADAVPGIAEPVKATFAWWPVDRPNERTEWTSSEKSAGSIFRYDIYAGLMEHGTTYAFAVRAADRDDTSAWSPECRFTIDTVSPPSPTVTSTDYPSDRVWPGHGGPGIPGEFTFSANGGDDVKGYYYGESGLTNYVAADSLGASVTVSYAPDADGPRWLYVASVDRAGNRSPQTRYDFIVRSTRPTVTDHDPGAGFGQPRRLMFAPGMENVVEYTYRLNNEPEQTVSAGPDGTAQVTITPNQAGVNELRVRSRTSDNLPSGEARYYFYLSTLPTISSEQYPFGFSFGAPVGTPGTFVFRPGMEGVVEYVWKVNAEPEQTVAAAPDGTASVTYTPTTTGLHTIEVYSRTSDGAVSETASEIFWPTSHAPSVESTSYPQYAENGGPGVTGQFTLRPARDGVTGYVYSFDNEEETVTAGADGVATISWTPKTYPAGGWVRLTVRSVSGEIVSDATEYAFRIKPLAPIVASDDYPPHGGGGPGIPGEFTLTAQMPGSTEFVYRYRGEEQTVPVGPDGTATITLTPGWDGGQYLYVHSRGPGGLVSGEDYYYFYVLYQP